jgi:hypothetical protein
MLNFQAAQRRHMGDGLPLEQLCAVINNNVRCYEESLEFAEQLEANLVPSLKGARPLLIVLWMCGILRCCARDCSALAGEYQSRRNAS